MIVLGNLNYFQFQLNYKRQTFLYDFKPVIPLELQMKSLRSRVEMSPYVQDFGLIALSMLDVLGKEA